MRRREFITLLGGVVAWPLTARARRADRVMRIGVLMSYVESDSTAHQWTNAFSQSLPRSGLLSICTLVPLLLGVADLSPSASLGGTQRVAGPMC
jgi:hypothetical protein